MATNDSTLTTEEGVFDSPKSVIAYTEMWTGTVVTLILHRKDGTTLSASIDIEGSAA